MQVGSKHTHGRTRQHAGNAYNFLAYTTFSYTSIMQPWQSTATVDQGHHLGFGKWCHQVPLGSISKGNKHTTLISSSRQANAAVLTADSMR